MRGLVCSITTPPRLQIVTCGHTTNALQDMHGLRSHLCFCSQDLLYHLTKRRSGLHSERLHLFRVGAFATASYGQSILDSNSRRRARGPYARIAVVATSSFWKPCDVVYRFAMLHLPLQTRWRRVDDAKLAVMIAGTRLRQ